MEKQEDSMCYTNKVKIIILSKDLEMLKDQTVHNLTVTAVNIFLNVL